jgi:ferredoxin-NADP reductase
MQQMLKLRVVKTETLTSDIRRIELCGVDGQTLPPFAAGAHISIQIRTHAGDISRNYSLINARSQGRHYEIAVLRRPDGGGGSLFMCDDLRVGDVVLAGAPKNDFPMADEATEQVLIAGGIGVTPILSMAETLASTGCPFEFHYSARRRENMAFLERVVAAAAGRARLYFDDGDPKNGIDLTRALRDPAPGRHAYVCGPRGMIDATIATARKLDWRPTNLHFELFTAPSSQAGDRPIEVVAKASNRTVLVPSDKSILECLIEAGLDPLFDCKRGECGACVTTVVEGLPDHRDYILDDATRSSGTSMCICVSRARGDKLVLDI